MATKYDESASSGFKLKSSGHELSHKEFHDYKVAWNKRHPPSSTHDWFTEHHVAVGSLVCLLAGLLGWLWFESFRVPINQCLGNTLCAPFPVAGGPSFGISLLNPFMYAALIVLLIGESIMGIAGRGRWYFALLDKLTYGDAHRFWDAIELTDKEKRIAHGCA